MAKKWPKKVSAAHREVQQDVESAVDFIFSEFEDNWSRAEKYYSGGCDIESDVGRSQVVKTVVRDSIRALKPSVFRTLLQARKIVDYAPTSMQYGSWAEQQSEYITQLFWKCDGYRQLMAAFDTAAKLKIGPMKVYWEENSTPEYFERRFVDEDMLEALINDETLLIEDVSEEDGDDYGMVLYKVEGYTYHKYGKIKLEAVPNYEFFISRNASSVEEACKKYVHGQRRLVTVEEAEEMGLTYDRWDDLDWEDPEQNEHTNSSYYRRRYEKDGDYDLGDVDPLQREFLLTECYVRYDLEGNGIPQLYCFWLGGTSYELIDYEKVEDSPFEVMQIDPIPFTVMANSIADLSMEEQDLSTSILRAIADNFHMSNNPRQGGDPRMVNFDDLSSRKIGAPFRTRGDYQIQTIAVPFTGQAGLPLLDYLDRDVEEKIGYTKAAAGLDPDAMQSTDKDAVLNTIQLSQGQVELVVRNLIETCLIPLFSKMLKLTVAYGDPVQVLRTKGALIPLPTGVLDPTLIATPRVGLGTGSPQERIGALQMILARQEQTIAEYGLDNPITSLRQMFNTIEDSMEIMGVTDLGRYFNIVTPDMEAQIAQKQQEAAQAAQENAPPDQVTAFLQIETAKNELEKQKAMLKHREKQLDNELSAILAAERLDLDRDGQVQTRVIELAKIQADEHNEAIKAEQKANDNRMKLVSDRNRGQQPNGTE